ncbi:MAG: ATP-binding protein [Polyangiaceae bacterium]
MKLPREADTAEPELRTFALWFMRLRWLALGILLVAYLAAALTPGVLPDAARWPLGASLLYMPLANLTLALVHRRIPVSDVSLLIQVLSDLLVLAFIWYWAGGLESPIAILLVLHILMTGSALGPRHCYLAAAWIGSLVAILAVLEALGAIPHHHLGTTAGCSARSLGFVGSWLAFLAVQLVAAAYLTANISQRARTVRERLQEAAAAATAQQQLLERALDTTGSGLRLVNADLKTTWASTLWQRWLSTESRVRRPDALRQVFETGRVKVREFTRKDPGNGARALRQTFRLTAAPIVGADGKVRQAAELVQDVTNEKRTQAEMVRTGKLVAVGELAAVVAHEINNPLGILNAKAQLLIQTQLPTMSPKVAAEVQKIYELSERVAGIAQGLLSACRPARGARKRVDMRAPLRRVLSMMEAERTRKGVQVQDDLESPLWVLANSSELEQVFLNLVLNAFHAIPDGGALRLSSPAAREQGRLAILVEDNGQGIPPEHLERVWEPFFSTKAESHGTGLGLSVCMTIVQSHGGDIEIESEVGRGTTARVELPEYDAREEGADRDTPHPRS